MIDEKTIKKMAYLAKLSIDDKHIHQYSDQLSKALSYFDQISQINTEGVEPLVTPTEIEMNFREDFAQNDFSPEELVANAPAAAGNLFKVPPVV